MGKILAEVRWFSILFWFVLIVLGSYISFTIPYLSPDIPFTAQSLVVFLAAVFLKPKEFLLAIGIYLLSGSIGLPVFASGTAGINKLVGPSGGFLYGFLFSGMLISYLFESLSLSNLHALLVFLLGTLVLFSCGIFHLSLQFNFPKAIEFGLIPFWKMGLLKAIIAWLITSVFYQRTA